MWIVSWAALLKVLLHSKHVCGTFTCGFGPRFLRSSGSFFLYRFRYLKCIWKMNVFHANKFIRLPFETFLLLYSTYPLVNHRLFWKKDPVPYLFHYLEFRNLYLKRPNTIEGDNQNFHIVAWNGMLLQDDKYNYYILQVAVHHFCTPSNKKKNYKISSSGNELWSLSRVSHFNFCTKHQHFGWDHCKFCIENRCQHIFLQTNSTNFVDIDIVIHSLTFSLMNFVQKKCKQTTCICFSWMSALVKNRNVYKMTNEILKHLSIITYQIRISQMS